MYVCSCFTGEYCEGRVTPDMECERMSGQVGLKQCVPEYPQYLEHRK
jgi:hypothetical protein